jgi:hypothetical protein
MELKYVNPNGNNVVVSNLVNVKKKNSKIVKILVQKQKSCVILSKRCHKCPKKNSHIVHLTNQH